MDKIHVFKAFQLQAFGRRYIRSGHSTLLPIRARPLEDRWKMKRLRNEGVSYIQLILDIPASHIARGKFGQPRRARFGTRLTARPDCWQHSPFLQNMCGRHAVYE
jgi:hypothetical protein